MPITRIALLNYSDKQVKLSITTGDKVGWWELGTDTDVKAPETQLATQPADKAWDVVIEPGAVYGFATEKGAKISEDPSIKVIAESGKDPWPKPPPPPLYKSVGDFNDRFANFLMAVGGGAVFPALLKEHARGERPFLIITPVHESHSS